LSAVTIKSSRHESCNMSLSPKYVFLWHVTYDVTSPALCGIPFSSLTDPEKLRQWFRVQDNTYLLHEMCKLNIVQNVLKVQSSVETEKTQSIICPECAKSQVLKDFILQHELTS